MVVAIGAVATTSAWASDLVDGTVSASGESCSWTNGTTTADPPSALTIAASSINGHLTCSSGVSATLNNDPNVTFDDSANTATADLVDATVDVSGISCRYQIANYVLSGSASTRQYSGSASAPLDSGSFLCPNPETVTTSLTFH
jgi:hypothetical protein